MESHLQRLAAIHEKNGSATWIPGENELGPGFAELAADLPSSIKELLETNVLIDPYDTPVDNAFLHAKEVSKNSAITRQHITPKEYWMP